MSRHGPLTINKGSTVQVPERERIPGDSASVFCEPLAALAQCFRGYSEDTAEGERVEGAACRLIALLQ